MAAAVGVVLDEVAGSGELGAVAEEAGAVEVDVGEVERHRAALGDLLGLVQGRAGRGGIVADDVIERGGEKGIGKEVQPSRVADAVHRAGDVRQVERRLRQRVRQHCPNQPDPGQSQVIEGDLKEPVFSGYPPQGRRCSAFDFGATRGMARLVVRYRDRRGACAAEEGLPGGAFGGGQEPVAVADTWQRREQVELRLRCFLHPFGFGEERAGFGA